MTNKFKNLIEKVKSKLSFKRAPKNSLPEQAPKIKKPRKKLFANFKKGRKFSFPKISFPGRRSGPNKVSSTETTKTEITRKLSQNSKLSSFNLGEADKFFSAPQYKNNLHKSFQVAFVVLFFFTIGKLSALLLKKALSPDTLQGENVVAINANRLLSKQELEKLKNSQLFKTEKTEKAAPKDNRGPIKTNIACTQASRKSALPIKLINTVVLQDSVKSIASVQVRSQTPFQELRVGEKIDNLAKVDKIERLRLIVKNLQTGTCESIESLERDKDSFEPLKVMSPAKATAFKKATKIQGIENDGNKFVIEKSFLKDKMKNINDVLNQAVGVPINNPDGTISFKISYVQPGSVFSALGISSGDIISGVGGEPIRDFNAIMGTFSKLSTLDKTSITIERNGSPVTQQYIFK